MNPNTIPPAQLLVCVIIAIVVAVVLNRMERLYRICVVLIVVILVFCAGRLGIEVVIGRLAPCALVTAPLALHFQAVFHLIGYFLRPDVRPRTAGR